MVSCCARSAATHLIMVLVLEVDGPSHRDVSRPRGEPGLPCACLLGYRLWPLARRRGPVSAVGESNRAPFDLPEAESELVGGFHTEYSSLKFALFMLAEYVNMTTVSALCTTLFLGGWRAPWPISLWGGANHGWWPVVWLVGKVLVLLSVFIWLRGTLPRLRYDQFMRLGWKVLIPVSLVWTLVVAGIRLTRSRSGLSTVDTSLIFGAATVVLLVVAWKWPRGRPGAPVARRPPDEGRVGAAEGSRCHRWTWKCHPARGPAGRSPSAETGPDDAVPVGSSRGKGSGVGHRDTVRAGAGDDGGTRADLIAP
jgi:hypothetical protein